jgi:rhodanese-related sulfurtransferase
MIDYLLLIFITYYMYNKYEQELLMNKFKKYMHNAKKDWNYITPKELYKMNKNKLYLLDIRKNIDYKNGHIKGSHNIYWLDILDNLDKLPKDKSKEIILICYLGYTASQVLVILQLLGYKAKVLKFGMGVSPDEKVPIAGWNTLGYPIVKK